MKTLILLVIVFAGGYAACRFLTGSKPLTRTNTSVIEELKRHPGAHTDQDLDIECRIIRSETLLNFTKSTIADSKGNEIVLVGNKPYQHGENVNVRARLLVLYQGQDKQNLVLIANDLTMLNRLLPLLERHL